MFISPAAKCNLGRNEVTERLQSVSLLLGEDEKTSFHKNKAELASRVRSVMQLHRIAPGCTLRFPFPHSAATLMATASATIQGGRSSVLGGLGNSAHGGLVLGNLQRSVNQRKKRKRKKKR